MSDPSTSPQSAAVQESVSSTITVVETVDEQDREVPTLKVKLKKPKNDKKVKWTTETVDNEHLNKKKSKCCCIYEKPRPFGESSSSSEDSDIECEHCKGHVERKKKKRNTGTSTIVEQPQTITTVLSDDPSNGNADKGPEKSDKNDSDANPGPNNTSS